ncbi:F-box/kelch-repeat protein [Pyrus ussuriensis x Pyrus communis]|uniref:F-box/kelch-repeat protein n=1 Tax=Pyrus ussuriensis x Pyrus communis TaxID=2448454 RepID=A0A5N5HTF7_9ROSA|nr:F-box/kelch-repeat protein [Pyrus ussuriensis x Pyrus communis]
MILWQQAFHDGVQARCKNPSTWVMNHGCFNHDGEIFSILELSDPSTKQTYCIGDIITQEVRELFVDAKPCASRYGWLLLTKKVKVEDGSSTKFFFYNPFKNKVIELSSPLILTNKIARHKATFTASPTTSRGDCAVFVVSKIYNHVYVLSTYKLADRAWRTIYITDRILPAEYVLDVKAKELVYMDGILFCTFHSKPSHTTLLGAFNVALESWDMIDCSVFANKIRCGGCKNCYGTSLYVYYLVEVPFSKVYLVAQQDYYHEWHAFEYDGSDNKWFEVESFIKTFENQALFIKRSSSVAIEEFSDEIKGVVAVEEKDMTRKEIEREMESKMELKMKRKKDRNVDIRYDDMQDRRDRKWKRWMEMQREIELEREMEREIEREPERESERERERERQEQDLVPSSPPHSPQTPTNAVPVVEERRREKDNKRAKKQRTKARRNTMQRGTAGGDGWCQSVWRLLRLLVVFFVFYFIFISLSCHGKVGILREKIEGGWEQTSWGVFSIFC